MKPNWLDRVAYTVICVLIGMILGASWVLYEVGPMIDTLTQETITQDGQIKILKVDNEILKGLKDGKHQKKGRAVGNQQASKMDSRYTPKQESTERDRTSQKEKSTGGGLK